MKDNKSYINQSFSNLHYNYFNPNTSLINKNFNNFKRKRFKDSYTDLANEKRDFISFEINQKELEKLNSLLSMPKKKYNSKSANNKINFNMKNVEIKKIEKPFSISLRNRSSLDNNSGIENIFDENKILTNYKKNNQSKLKKRKIKQRSQRFHQYGIYGRRCL